MNSSAPKITLVDDEKAVLDSIRRRLRVLRPKWQVAAYSSAIEALAAIKENPVDAVITDMRMPEMSGLELIDGIRQVADIPCIVLTGSPDLTSALYAINEADVFRFYTKPCYVELLVEGVEAALLSRPAALVESVDAMTAPGAADVETNAITTQIGLAALNRLALGVIVVDREGRIAFTNKSAGVLLSESDGVSVCSQNILRASGLEATTALMSLVEAAIDDETGAEEDTNAVALVRPSLKRPLSAFVSPIIPDQSQGKRDRLAAVFISDPERQPVPSLDHIMRLYHLSRSQALIVQSLAKGARVEEAADDAGVTVSTARTYLKQVFLKTETSRQSELLKLVLASPRMLAS